VPTAIELTHLFPATTPRALLGAFTHPDHQAMQDRFAKVARREVIERTDDAHHYRCECRVFPERQLPAFIRPFVRGGLEYHEVVTWDKATDLLEIDVQPAVLGGRSRIRATSRVIAEGAATRRVYAGLVTVEVALLGGRIERSIVAELGTTMEAAVERTRAWLLRP
jgi:hypothetical protein